MLAANFIQTKKIIACKIINFIGLYFHSAFQSILECKDNTREDTAEWTFQKKTKKKYIVK